MAAREAEQKVAFSGLEKATSTDLMFTDRRNSILSYHIGRSWSKNKFDNKRKEEIKAPPVTTVYIDKGTRMRGCALSHIRRPWLTQH